MGLKPLRQKAELKRSRVRSLKCVLLKRMNKKARLNLSAFVWRRVRSSSVKQCQAGSRAEDLGGVKQKSAACAGQDQAEQGKFKPISPVKRFFLKAKSKVLKDT